MANRAPDSLGLDMGFIFTKKRARALYAGVPAPYWVPPAPFPLVPPSHFNIPPRSLAAARHGIWMLRLQSPR